jgi:hypothetical protein
VIAAPMTIGAPTPGVGFGIATGDTGSLGQAYGQLSTLGSRLDEYSGHVAATAASVGPSWTGAAANSYQQLSDLISAHFRDAAETSRTAAATIGRYRDELDRCQREGMTATREAERCLLEIKTQTSRLHAAQTAATQAQNALSAAFNAGSAARAAGPLGVVSAAAADVQASAARVGLAGAQSDALAAQRALERAREELKLWQGRGRAAWQDAQTAADQASGTLQALVITPPPLAGIPPFAPLTATAPPGLRRGPVITPGGSLPGGPLINPGGPSLGGILGFTASPLKGSVTVYDRQQPKQLSEAEKQAIAKKAAGQDYDKTLYKSAKAKQTYNEKVQTRTRNQQKRQGNNRDKPKGS